MDINHILRQPHTERGGERCRSAQAFGCDQRKWFQAKQPKLEWYQCKWAPHLREGSGGSDKGEAESDLHCWLNCCDGLKCSNGITYVVPSISNLAILKREAFNFWPGIRFTQIHTYQAGNPSEGISQIFLVDSSVRNSGKCQIPYSFNFARVLITGALVQFLESTLHG